MDKKQIETWEQCLLVWHLFLKKKKKNSSFCFMGKGSKGSEGEPRVQWDDKSVLHQARDGEVERNGKV